MEMGKLPRSFNFVVKKKIAQLSYAWHSAIIIKAL